MKPSNVLRCRCDEEDDLYVIVHLSSLFGQFVDAGLRENTRYTESMNMQPVKHAENDVKFADLSSQATVTPDDVVRIAELAHLELTTEEQSEMLRDLNSVLGHVAHLNELDTTGVAAMAQVKEVVSGAPNEANQEFGSALRADVPRASLDRQAVMAQAPESDGVYFKVPKVIER
ncbi:MAG TPA: Asp-tRNA(Asn)/Glu-tRNA(Gln) amidotransferase subunit GatC [Acidobacteriaceae bacterium]|nr:Asp-tRNA(Asn)/Glu-tRNA(Gln) amidotransferase subunit GatC [Acidobacteriaceae bacterium]